MKKNGLQRYNEIVESYKEYYFKYNNKHVVDIEYRDGYVYLTTNSSGIKSTNKIRIGLFEKMTETLKSRLEK